MAKVTRWVHVRSWGVWSVRKPALAALLLVEFITLAISVVVVGQYPVHRRDWLIFVILAVGSVLHMQAVRGVGRMRSGGVPANAPFVDLKSIWSFAGLILLPPSLSTTLVAITVLHLFLRSRTPLFRSLYNLAVVLLATYAASAVLYVGLPVGEYPGLPMSWRGVAVVALAAAVRWFVNFGLVVAIILLSAPKTPAQEALGSLSNSLVEVTALCLGAVTALVTVTDPWYIALILPLVLVLHRNLLLRQYEVAARTDAKTGLANAVHWSQLARTELARAERDGTALGVLMLDLDHFKRVNDTYGHLTGDAVLNAVADALRKECREYDVVGRFGGEEFMILTPGVDPVDLMSIAERFRARIGGLVVTSPDTHESVRVTASAGVVAYPSGGHDLDELLLAADAALYQAKEGGRNRTCVSPLAPRPRPALPSELPKARQSDD